MGHLCCLKLIENKVGAFGDFFFSATRRTGAIKAQDLESAFGESNAGVFVKESGIGVSLFTTPRDKRLSYMMHPASKYKESRQLSRHST